MLDDTIPPPPPGFDFDVNPIQASVRPEGESIPPPPVGFDFDRPPTQATPTEQKPVAFGSLARNAVELRSGLRVGEYMLGHGTPEDFAAGLAEDQINLAKYPKTEDQLQLEKEIPEQGLMALAKHPGGTLSMLGEGIPSMLATIPAAMAGGLAGGAVGGPAGAFVGTAGGVGLAAGATSYGAEFQNFLRQQGVDLTDPNSTLAALKNPELVNEAHWYAAKKAGISAAFNAAGAAVGGKLALRFFTPETKILSTAGAKGLGSLGVVAAGTQAATEAAQGVAVDEPVDPQQVMVDAFLAGISNLIPMAAPGLSERAARGVKRVKTEKDITNEDHIVDEHGNVIETQKTEPLPEETVAQVSEPFRGFDARELEALKVSLKASDVASARPEEWNKVLAKGTDEQSIPRVFPKDSVDTDAPISRADMIRNIEEKQLVVSEDEPKIRPKSAEQAAEPTILDRTLIVSKESLPEPVPPVEGIETPVVSSTRGNLIPVAKLEVAERTDTQGRRLLMVEHVVKPEHIPTESDWGELVTQRVGRYAAESGFDAISWPQEGPKSETPVVGDAALPHIAAEEVSPVKKVGDQVGSHRLTVQVKGRRGRPVKLEAMSTAEFAAEPIRIPKHVAEQKDLTAVLAQAASRDKSLAGPIAAAELAIKALREILPHFKLSKPLQVILEKGQSTSFGDYFDAGTHHQIRIHLDAQVGSVASAERAGHPADVAASIYTTMWHEFGHALAMDKWGTTDHSTQALFMDAHRILIKEPAARQGRTVGQNEFTRRNYAKALQLGLPDSQPGTIAQLGTTDPQYKVYVTSFAEFFAEQVAKWSTTSEKPLTILEKWFYGLYGKLRDLFDIYTKKFPGETGQAHPDIHTWLDSFVKDVQRQFNVGWFAQMARSLRTNKAALVLAGQGQVPATQKTPSSTFSRTMTQKLFGKSGVPASTMAGHALQDKFNLFYKYMLGLPQLAARNPGIWGLQRYTEFTRAMHIFRQQMVDRANTTIKLWHGIGRENGKILQALLEEYSDMSYRTPAEIAAGVKRMPSPAELQTMMQQLKVTPEVAAVFKKIVGDFDFMLDQYADNLKTSAQYSGMTPVVQALAFQRIDKEIQRMRDVPYFPFLRFGDYTLTIRDKQFGIVHFETFELERQRNRAAEEAEKVYPKGAFDIYRGKLPEDVKPLLGMPPGLMDKIADSLKLSPNQKKYLAELRFELAPGQSFKHRFQMKKRTSGYSNNFLRAYANYMFHGSSHIARTKYVEPMHRMIDLVRKQSEYMPDGTKRSEIASYMGHHLEQIIDAKSDFVRLKGLIFHFALGMNPAAAALNLSQQLIGTMPFLMAKFGDVRGVAGMIGAQTRWKTYWREGSYQKLAPTDFHSEAMAESIKGGVLTEAMAPELAAVSEDRNLLKWFGPASERLWWNVGKVSSWMFQTSEKMNRRVTFMAALDLALKNPNNKYVADVVAANQVEYTRLVGEKGWTDLQARAYLTATDAVRATQFEYAAYARPQLFQGKKGALFIFKSFQLNTLFMLWNYPSAAVRSMLIMGFLGGLMGIPGTEDLSDILKVLGYQLFGKNWDVEREARQFVRDVSDGTVDSSMILHGISRKGYGIPAVMDMLGEWTGEGDVPFPSVDRSGNIGIGPLLPAPLSPLLGPVSDPNRAIAQTAQRASGAAFSVAFNLYKSLVDPQLSAWDMKRWERAMPTALRNISRMYRVYNEGMERSGGGNPIQKFDPNDTEQMAEILSMGLGYNPTALTEEYDKNRLVYDQQNFLQLRHDVLLRQLGNAYVMKDKEEIDNVKDAIRSFNRTLPKEGRGYAITREGVERSVQERQKGFKLRQLGRPADKRQAPLIKVIDPLFPEEVARRRVH